MDERHWWIAEKIRETFKMGDNPINATILESYMCEEYNLSAVTKFLRAGGPCRLFFYCNFLELSVCLPKELHVTDNPAHIYHSDSKQVSYHTYLLNVNFS